MGIAGFRPESRQTAARERIRDAKQHRASQLLFNGGKRPFGFDVEGEGKNRHLVPNPTEQAALTRGKALQSEGATLRAIASMWADEFGLKKFDANSVRPSSGRRAAGFQLEPSAAMMGYR